MRNQRNASPSRSKLTIMKYLIGLPIALIMLSAGCTEEPSREPAPTTPYITSKQPITILSVNDGDSHLRLSPDETLDRRNHTEDSITTVHLGPDHPPIVKTVYGTVPNTISGAPYMAMSGDGRYGFVTSRNTGSSAGEPEGMTVTDLASPDLAVIASVEIPNPMMVAMHPNGRHIIVPCGTGFQVFEMQNSALVLLEDNKLDVTPGSMDISPKGDRIIATGRSVSGAAAHVYSYREEDGTIEHFGEVGIQEGLSAAFRGPFSGRFSPDGSRFLMPNGSGIGTKGILDDILSIDMTMEPPMVTEVVRQVADGMESLAFHPNGQMAVVACLEEFRIRAHITYSHLAVIDLTTKPAQVLYYVNIESVPEGIEFSPDGTQLFIGTTSGNHITVFDVDEFTITRHPFVIRVGHGPASMAIGLRYQP